MVVPTRIELVISDYQSLVIPFNYRTINLVDRKRFELLTSPCKGDVFPTIPTAQILVDAVRVELTQFETGGLQPLRLSNA